MWVAILISIMLIDVDLDARGGLSVDVEVDLLHGVARVLVHDALRRLAERRDRPVVPPLLQVPVLVELPPCDEMYQL